jgi:hypothetical protein
MALTRLHDDLLLDFKAQKALIYEQIELIDPLGEQLSKPAARRLVDKGVLIFTEVACYVMAAASVAFAFFLDKIYPFYILEEIRFRGKYADLGWQNTMMLQFAVYGLIAAIALAFYLIARCVRQMRLKNDILNFAGKQIKLVLAQHLRRKAAIEAIEQRHFEELPAFPYDQPVMRVNDVPNPGY